VYLDANVFIYFLERHAEFIDAVTPVFEAAYAGRLVAVTGQVGVAEVMVGPYRTRDAEIIRGTTEFFETRNLFEIRAHGTRDFDDAARLRADIGLPLVDALHLATARRAQCEYFLTNDSRMPDIPGLTVIQVDSLRGEEPQ
jgi:predicted nucleic acid-binding protein